MASPSGACLRPHEALPGLPKPHNASYAVRGAPWSLGRKSCAQAQYELSTACRAEGTESRPCPDKYELNIAQSSRKVSKTGRRRT
eukprot:6732525-Prymnesium_polylepis.1